MGGWLFRQRTWLPLPIGLALLVLPRGWTPIAALQTPPSPGLTLTGAAIVATGELLRLWGVHHIGAISRTRSDRLGPLVAGGPFGLVRNPLYIGNIGLWIGFAVSAALVWLVPLIVLLLAAEYHAIVRWEETLLEARLGGAYRDYAARVPRWLPQTLALPERRGDASTAFSWGDTFFSERGTLIAIAAGYLLLWIKASFP